MRELYNAPVTVCLTPRQKDALDEFTRWAGAPSTGAYVRALIVETVPARFYREIEPPPGQLRLSDA